MSRITFPSALILAASLGFTSLAFAETSSPTEPTDPEIEAIQKKYEAEFQKLEARAKEIEEKAPDGAENMAGVEWDGKMKRHEINFDVPEFRMALRRIVFDVPEIKMELKRIVWDNPETVMELKTVGKYPEFHGLKVKWSDIKMHVPVVRMVRREAKLHLPKVTMKRIEWKLHLPEIFKTRRVRWVFDLPEVKVRTTESAKKEVVEESNRMKETSEALASAQQTEIKGVALKRLNATREQLRQQYDTAVSHVTDAINNAKNHGIDPANLVGEDGAKTNLVEVLDEVNLKFSAALKDLDQKIAEMQG